MPIRSKHVTIHHKSMICFALALELFDIFVGMTMTSKHKRMVFSSAVFDYLQIWLCLMRANLFPFRTPMFSRIHDRIWYVDWASLRFLIGAAWPALPNMAARGPHW